jgi:hypothetical protein
VKRCTARCRALNESRITYLGHLNLWRNYVAHDGTSPPAAGGPFHLAATSRSWKNSWSRCQSKAE